MRLVLMVLLRDPGEVYCYRQDAIRGRLFKLPVSAHVEKIDPVTLARVRRSPRLEGGPFWAGGFCIHRNGDLYATIGRRLHRLDPDCGLVGTCVLPIDRPYNSHLVLDNGLLVTKPYSSEGRSLLTVIDPETLEPVCDHVEMLEPSIARISADGNTTYVVGVRHVFRYLWDDAAARPVLDDGWRFDYVGDSGQDYGWDPVIDERDVWFTDNGRYELLFSMVGAGKNENPIRLIRVSRTDAGDNAAWPICSQPFGSSTNPPFYAADRRVLVAYDSSNRFTRAWRQAENGQLAPLWEKQPWGTGGHMVYFPDTGELVSNDYRPWRGDSVVVLDLESGDVKGRVRLGNLNQGLGFSCPGWNRDLYFVGMDQLARVWVD